MTANQLKYHALQEEKRSNLAKELETNRSNLAREVETNRSNLAKEGETARSNLVHERETERHNRHGEAQGYLKNLSDFTSLKNPLGILLNTLL